QRTQETESGLVGDPSATRGAKDPGDRAAFGWRPLPHSGGEGPRSLRNGGGDARGPEDVAEGGHPRVPGERGSPSQRLRGAAGSSGQRGFPCTLAGRSGGPKDSSPTPRGAEPGAPRRGGQESGDLAAPAQTPLRNAGAGLGAAGAPSREGAQDGERRGAGGRLRGAAPPLLQRLLPPLRGCGLHPPASSLPHRSDWTLPGPGAGPLLPPRGPPPPAAGPPAGAPRRPLPPSLPPADTAGG
ncbi:hypothetical protein G0U57_013508, partial [Chelydra serpentina]